MIKISVFLEDKSGKTLGEAHSEKEKIIIGSSDECSLKINDNKISPIESEIYSVSGECWIQVTKEGAPLTFNNRQYRTLKIEKNSEIQFRNYKLKILIESAAKKQEVQPGFDLSLDSTKILNEPTNLVLDDATRIVKKEEAENSSEATRVVPMNEATRIVANHEATRAIENNEATRVVDLSEATRIVQANEATRVENLEKEETLEKFNFDENKTRIVDYKETKKEKLTKKELSVDEEEDDFFFNKSNDTDNVRKLSVPPELIKYVDTHLKEIAFFAFAAFVCLLIGKTLLFNGKSKKIDLEQLANSQIQTLKKESASSSAVDSNKLMHVEKTVQAVSKEDYLRELSSLFDKN